MTTGITDGQTWETVPKPLTPREKVLEWLYYISATPDEIDEVVKQCETDKEAVKYFLMRHREDCNGQYTSGSNVAGLV